MGGHNSSERPFQGGLYMRGVGVGGTTCTVPLVRDISGGSYCIEVEGGGGGIYMHRGTTYTMVETSRKLQ